MSQQKGEPLRWTVCVTGRAARGKLRDYTSYHTDVERTDAEDDALAGAARRWPVSTVPIEICSYHNWPHDLERREL
jgi:hypothetical protein